MGMNVDGASKILKSVTEPALEEIAKREVLNLFGADSMTGLRARPARETEATQWNRRDAMEDILAKMGAGKDKKQAFDIGTGAAADVVMGGFKAAGDALGGIKGIGDALGCIGKAAGELGGMMKQLMPVIMAIASFF